MRCYRRGSLSVCGKLHGDEIQFLMDEWRRVTVADTLWKEVGTGCARSLARHQCEDVSGRLQGKPGAPVPHRRSHQHECPEAPRGGLAVCLCLTAVTCNLSSTAIAVAPPPPMTLTTAAESTSG